MVHFRVTPLRPLIAISLPVILLLLGFSHPHRGHGRFGRGMPCPSHQVGGTTPELAVLRGNWGWMSWQVWSVVEWSGEPDRGGTGAGCWWARAVKENGT
jgi:hypothetical protein